MQKLTTFEDIFNRLIENYKGQTVEINVKQTGVSITNFKTSIDNIIIKPLDKKQSRKLTGKSKKIGLIIIQEKNKNKYYSTIKMPFLLGYDTMDAVFLKSGVTIKTLNMEFNIRKLTISNKKLA